MSKSTSFSVGFDVSDCTLEASALNTDGRLDHERTVSLELAVLVPYLESLLRHKPIIALETGTHANWLYDLLISLGFSNVIVADARKLKMISKSDNKTDRLDARKLARLAQACPELLHAVQPRQESSRQDRRLLGARHTCVETRTKLISHVRGVVKSTGARLADCDAGRFPDFADSLPDDLATILLPVLDAVRQLNTSIEQFDGLIAMRCEGDPVLDRFQQVNCVGPITALAYRATIENPHRFPKNRQVGSFVGLRPRIDQSGEMEKQLRITKAGDGYLRQLLVMSAQGILRRNSKASDLKRWGLSIAEKGGKRAKRRAAVAVARKLAVLLLSMWKSESDYVPLRAPSAPPVATHKVKSVRKTKVAA